MGQGARVVLEMTDHLKGTGRNCTGDNFFTSLTLSRALLSHKMTFLGTVRKNKQFIPPALKNTKNRAELSSVFAFEKDHSLVSYLPKKNGNIFLLSSQHKLPEVDTSDSRKKPLSILEYNHTKGAVDTLDKLVRTYSCVRKSRRWPVVLFNNFLDIACYNALVCFLFVNPYYEQGKSHRRRVFLEALAKDMIQPNIIRKHPCLPLNADIVNSQIERKRKRCGDCQRGVDKKTIELCRKCMKPVCKEHLIIVCKKCY